jgi:hypothetical protein
VSARKTMTDIYREVDQLIERRATATVIRLGTTRRKFRAR